MSRTPSKRKKLSRSVPATVLIFLAVWGLASPAMVFQPLLFGDDASYVAHAMTIAIDFDLDYSNEIATRVRERPSGASTPTHPIGPGILAAPFVAAFSLVDRAIGHPVIIERAQFSGTWSFLGFYAASAGALLAGAWFYVRVFSALGVRLSRAFVLLLLAGTGVAFYGLNRFTMGHSFEFAMAGLVLWASVLLSVHRRWRGLLVGALVLGIVLSILIRPANINIVILPALTWTALRVTGVSHRPLLERAETRRLLLFVAPGVLLLMLFNLALYGFVFPSRNQMYGMRSRSLYEQLTEVVRALPSLRHVLFSSEYGIIFFMPVVPVGIALVLFLVYRASPETASWRLKATTFLLGTLYVSVPMAVVLIWQAHARSYGYRYLFSLIPIGMLGVALWWRRPQTRSHAYLKTLLGMLSTFAVLAQVFFQTGPNLRPSPGLNAFGRDYSHAAVGYGPNVLEAIVSLSAWVHAAIMRFPGFAGGLLLGPERSGALAEYFGFVAVTRVSSGTEISPLTAFDWIESAATGVPIGTMLLVGLVVPLAFAALLRNRSGR